MRVPKRRNLDDRAKENSVALHSSSQDVMIFADQDSPYLNPYLRWVDLHPGIGARLRSRMT